MNYGYQAMNQMNTSAQQATGHVDAPLMTQEFDRIASSVSDLEGQLEWLIQKIQPICQAGAVIGSSGGLDTDKKEVQPSEVRLMLINLRNRIEGMSYRIAAVKYTIEV